MQLKCDVRAPCPMFPLGGRSSTIYQRWVFFQLHKPSSWHWDV
jgi:hypothetical protein